MALIRTCGSSSSFSYRTETASITADVPKTITATSGKKILSISIIATGAGTGGELASVVFNESGNIVAQNAASMTFPTTPSNTSVTFQSGYERTCTVAITEI